MIFNTFYLFWKLQYRQAAAVGLKIYGITSIKGHNLYYNISERITSIPAPSPSDESSPCSLKSPRLLQTNRIEKIGWNRLANDAQAVAGVHNITLHGRSAEGQASLVGGRRVLVGRGIPPPPAPPPPGNYDQAAMTAPILFRRSSAPPDHYFITTPYSTPGPTHKLIDNY